jgi:hypothetical protein
MALNGAGGLDSGSMLERFQQVRDLARKKLDEGDSLRGVDNRARLASRDDKLADLVKRKQEQMGLGSVSRAVPQAAPRITAEAGNTAPALSGLSAYGRAGAIDRADPKPRLGRLIDIMV